jgi:hypothetical protein
MTKTWSEKFHNGKEPIVAPSIRTISGLPPGSMMLIPIPSQIDDYIRAIPSGEERTVEQMAGELAQAAGADLTCPFCCGSFFRICAEKAFEEFQAGSPMESVAPFCRMLPPKSPVRKRLSFGTDLVDGMRAKERSGSTETGWR